MVNQTDFIPLFIRLQSSQENRHYVRKVIRYLQHSNCRDYGEYPKLTQYIRKDLPEELTFNLKPEGKEAGACKVVRAHPAEEMLCAQAR